MTTTGFAPLSAGADRLPGSVLRILAEERIERIAMADDIRGLEFMLKLAEASGDREYLLDVLREADAECGRLGLFRRGF